MALINGVCDIFNYDKPNRIIIYFEEICFLFVSIINDGIVLRACIYIDQSKFNQIGELFSWQCTYLRQFDVIKRECQTSLYVCDL